MRKRITLERDSTQPRWLGAFSLALPIAPTFCYLSAMRVDSKLESLVATFPSVMIGFSGGVDSALLAVVARRILGRKRSLAVMGVSASFPAVQREQAVSIARLFDLDLLEVRTDELSDPRYAANPTNRCYFCKLELWSRLRSVARARGIGVVADGTNADDLRDHRPGFAAAREQGVRSPLAEIGYAKADVRREARALDIPVWDAPAAPCLSSRLRYGLSVTPERLRQVERSEALLRRVGVRGDLRVRHWGDEARIEVDRGELALVRAHRQTIGDGLVALGFGRVTLDLMGYRRGSLLRDAGTHVELLAERC